MPKSEPIADPISCVTSLPGLAWVRDRTGRLVAASGLARARLGLELGTCLAEDDRAFLEGRLPDEAERGWSRPDFEVRLLVRRKAYGDGGDLAGWVVAVAEERLAVGPKLDSGAAGARSGRQQMLLELAERAAGAACFELDIDSGELSCTSSLLRILGQEPTVSPSWALIVGSFGPGGRSALMAGVQRAWELGEVFERELELETAGSRPSWVRVMVRREHDGAERRVLGSIHDVDRRRTEEVALARLAASLGGGGADRFAAATVRALAEAFRLDAVFFFELRGAARDLALNAGIRDGAMLAPRAPTRPSPACQQALQAERLMLADGASRRFAEDPWVAGFEGWGGVALRGAGGGALGLLVVASRCPLGAAGLLVPMLEIVAGRLAADVERQRATEQLREARVVVHRSHRLEALASFVGGLANELSSVLASQFAALDLATASLPAGHPLHAELQALEHATLSAEGLVRQLAAFSKPRVDARSDLDLGLVVRELEAVVQPLLAERVTLELRAASGGHRVRADRGEIEQILVNLVVNARDASPAAGTILVELTDGWLDAASSGELGALAPGPWRGLVVADQGSGIPAEHRERVFEPFFSTKGPGRGSGLGLATVREVAERLGGHVTVSRRPGWGAVFAVYLPAVVVAVGAESSAPCLAGPPTSQAIFPHGA